MPTRPDPAVPSGGASCRTTFQLVGSHSWTAVPAELCYQAREPFAVRIVFGPRSAVLDPGAEPEPVVEWLLSRDLLRAGTSRPAGEGDVRIWPGRGGTDALFVHLRAPSGEAVFEASLGSVSAFLAATERIVPLGGESDLLQVDDELAALLAGDGPDAAR